jgi:hypothetical protein
MGSGVENFRSAAYEGRGGGKKDLKNPILDKRAISPVI